MSDKEIEEMEAYQNLINRIAMSDKETKERIHNESEVSAKRAYIHKTSAQLGFKKGYISGAESERPKAWNEAIDACIKRLENEIQLWLIVHPDPQPGSPASYGIDSLNQAIRHIREFDKIKQP